MRASALQVVRLIGVLTCIMMLSWHSANATTSESDAQFAEAVAAVKSRDYSRAVKLFKQQAEASQHDAQYNLAVLLKAGKGTPQDFLNGLIWSWSAYLGGIEAAEDLADELLDLVPENSVETAREAVATRLQARVADGEKPAVMQFARYHLELLEEADYERAYVWYAIGAALGLEGAIDARDDALGDVDSEKIVDLQNEAGTIFEDLKFD